MTGQMGISDSRLNDMTGDAVGLTYPGTFLNHMLNICTKKGSPNGGEGQIKQAFMKREDSSQCPKCYLHITKQKLDGHVSSANCSKLDKYPYNKILIQEEGDKRFYCYHGCGTFKKKKELVDHLIDTHVKMDLKTWGINRDLLVKFRKKEVKKRDQKRALKSRSKKLSKG